MKFSSFEEDTTKLTEAMVGVVRILYGGDNLRKGMHPVILPSDIG